MPQYRTIKSILIFFLLLLPLRAAAPGIKIALLFESKSINPYDRLINAVVRVESAGDTLAYNKVEEAIGAFQIRAIRLLDFNRRTGNNYKTEDCFNYAISKEIFLYYAKLTGYPDYESIARNWNGSGRMTLDYWNKVKKLL
jgi:hypothetical protein